MGGEKILVQSHQRTVRAPFLQINVLANTRAILKGRSPSNGIGEFGNSAELPLVRRQIRRGFAFVRERSLDRPMCFRVV